MLSTFRMIAVSLKIGFCVQFKNYTNISLAEHLLLEIQWVETEFHQDVM